MGVGKFSEKSLSFFQRKRYNSNFNDVCYTANNINYIDTDVQFFLQIAFSDIKNRIETNCRNFWSTLIFLIFFKLKNEFWRI